MMSLTAIRKALVLGVALCCLGSTALASHVDVAQHGKRLTIGSGDDKITVLYLRGTPYEMGYSQGKLCSAEIHYMAKQVAPLMMFGMGCSPAKADATFKLYASHMRPEYLEELRGLADGSGVPLVDIERGTALPDISEWHCSFFAAFGSATKNGDVLQIRALDYTTDAGIQKYPALVVYDPPTGVPFVNVGWLGQIGMVTGMNSAGIAMSEIGDDWDKDTDTFDARPLNFVMRDSVQFGRTLDEAVNLVKDGPRTSSLLYCLSSAREKAVRALQTSHAKCYVYAPDQLPFARLQNCVYMSMGMDSKWNPKVGAALKSDLGKIDPEQAEGLMKRLGTGSLHAVVFEAGTGDMWVANATMTEKAYKRPFNHFNLREALSDPFFSGARVASNGSK